MTEQLLPCPFCGKTCQMHPSAHYHERFYAECEYCLVRTDDCANEEQAASDWNTRYSWKSDPAISDELKAAEQLSEESAQLEEAERLINEIRKIIASTHPKHAVQEVLIFIKHYKKKHQI